MEICEYCDKTFQSKDKLKRHQANIHDINVVWHHCGVDGCEYKSKDKYNLDKHKANIHNINRVWYVCDIDGCTKEFKDSSTFKRHQSAVHNIDVKWFNCDLCTDKFKTSENLNRHIRNVHGIDTIWYECDDCDYKAKAKADLEKHQDRMHNTNVSWYECDEENCDYKSKVKTDLYKHKQNIHLVNVKWHDCPIVGCTFKTKANYRLQEHLGYLHDIGDETCEFCLENRYRLIAYTNNKVTARICRTCLRKATGRDSRIEITMSKYLDKNFGTDFLIASDTKVYGEACQTYRPDKLYASPNLILHIECDEQQHIYSGNDYSCDEKRISEIYDEFPGHKYVVIRWNPDKYKLPQGKVRITTKAAKLELLLKCMENIIKNPPEEMIKIIYMFYDDDNELLSRNIPYSLVYDEKDINNLI